MPKLNITVACAAYGRTSPLISGRMPIDGCDANVLAIEPSEAFVRADRSQDFDVTE
jgi:4,5-dihydroxyphthalate decarboxylase